MFIYEFEEDEANLLEKINKADAGSWYFENINYITSPIRSITIHKSKGGKSPNDQKHKPSMKLEMQTHTETSKLEAMISSGLIKSNRFPQGSLFIDADQRLLPDLFEMISLAEKHLDAFDPKFMEFISLLLKIPVPAPIPAPVASSSSAHYPQSFFENPQQEMLTLLKTRTKRTEWTVTDNSFAITVEPHENIEILLNVILIVNDMPKYSFSGDKTPDGKRCIKVEGITVNPGLRPEQQTEDINQSFPIIGKPV